MVSHSIGTHGIVKCIRLVSRVGVNKLKEANSRKSSLKIVTGFKPMIVYPRFIEFLHFDIQSTGQKSHCINNRQILHNALF